MSNFENTAQSVGAFSQADDLKKRIIYTLFIYKPENLVQFIESL